MPCTGQPATHVHVAQSTFLASAGNAMCFPLGTSQNICSKSPELLCRMVLSVDQSTCRTNDACPLHTPMRPYCLETS